MRDQFNYRNKSRTFYDELDKFFIAIQNKNIIRVYSQIILDIRFLQRDSRFVVVGSYENVSFYICDTFLDEESHSLRSNHDRWNILHRLTSSTIKDQS